MNLNKVQIAGRLTRDPELRYLPNGTAICQIGVAVNRSWKEEVTFVDVTLWGKTGENVSQYLKKGNPIYVEGRPEAIEKLADELNAAGWNFEVEINPDSQLR